MPDDIDKLWAENVNVAKMKNADFERRTAKLSLYDSSGEIHALLSSMVDHYRMNRSEMVDQAIRIYLAHLIDTHDELSDLRDKYEITVLIPPNGWKVEHPHFGVSSSDEKGPIPLSLPPTVEDMMMEVIDGDVIGISQKSDFANRAVRWMNRGEECDHLDSFEAAIVSFEEDTHPLKEDEDEAYPSPLHYLYESDARQVLTDFFLTLGTQWEEGDTPLTKQDIIDRTGLTRKTIIEHIGPLVTMGIVCVTDGDGWDRYYPAVDNEGFWKVVEANNELYINWRERQ